MARKRKYLLTWHRPRNCWSKWYNGKRYYLAKGRCNGKTDRNGYKLALAEWQAIKAQVDRQNNFPPNFEAVSIPDLETAAYFASDYSSLSSDLSATAVLDQTTVAGLTGSYLEEKRLEVDAGQISAKMYAEHKAKLEDFEKFSKHFKKESLEEIDDSLLAKYRSEQLKLTTKEKGQGGISKPTARKRLATLKRFLDWAYSRGALENLPRVLLSDYGKIKLDPPKPDFYSPGEIDDIYDAASPMLQAAMLCGLNFGYTQTDVASLSWEMINRRKRIVSRDRQKTGTTQKHWIWAITLGALLDKSRSKSGLILTGSDGEPLVRDEIGSDGKLKIYDQIAGEFRKVKRKLGMTKDKRGFKHLRKSAANEIAKKYQDKPYLVDQFLGHSVGAMKKHYVNQHFDELYEACEYLDGVYNLEY